MHNLLKYLQGGDLRSIAGANTVVTLIKNQQDFDELLSFLFSKDRLVVMRAADAIEKITLEKPEYLTAHSHTIVNLMNTAVDKELKWHLALIAPRLHLSSEALGIVWNQLTGWAKDQKESKIVRVNAIQALFDLSHTNHNLKRALDLTAQDLKTDKSKSIQARLRKLTGA